MGAHDFQTSSTGENASKAYRNACEQATFEHGHDPYNGTISTTSSFRMYQTPEPEPHGPIMKMIRKDLGLTQADFAKIIGRSSGYISCHERGQNAKPLPSEEANKIVKYARSHKPYKNYRSFGFAEEGTKPKLRDEGYWLSDLKKSAAGNLTKRQWNKVVQDILQDKRFDKRGACACIQTGENHYTFIGWAAC